MSYTNIGSRLLMAASFVNNGDTVCDVGCDHGKLSLYLVKQGRANHIIATDINKQPLQKAIDLFEHYNLSRAAEFYQTDGLQGVHNTDRKITHVVIAGLGGTTMRFILESADFVKDSNVHLVLLPAQSGYNVRDWLYENGFEILTEKTVEENDKFYSCMDVVYTGKSIKPTIFDTYIGKSYLCTDSSAKGYFEMILKRLTKRQNGFVIDKGEIDEGYREAIEKVRKLIKNIE